MGQLDLERLSRSAASAARAGRADSVDDVDALVAESFAHLAAALAGTTRRVPVADVGRGLGRAVAAVTAIAGLVLRPDATGALHALSVAGTGRPADLDPAEEAAVEAVTEALLTVVARRKELRAGRTGKAAQARLALDLVEEGIMFLSADGRPIRLNRAAEAQLGCTIHELSASTAIWDQFDLRLADGSTVKQAADTDGWFDRVGVFGPVDMRLVNRQGLIVCGRLTVRAVATDADDDEPGMVALLNPVAGMSESAAPSSGPAIEAVLRRADELFDELQRTLSVNARPADNELPPALASAGLSAREREVVVLLLEGHRVSTIAQRLFVSPHTVRNHLKAIFRKAGVGSQAALIEVARASDGRATAS